MYSLPISLDFAECIARTMLSTDLSLTWLVLSMQSRRWSVFFFDMRKACDTKWRFGLLETLLDIGLPGSLACTIQSYLANRIFRTKIGTALSSVHSFDQGVPKEGVLSCTLFSLTISVILQSVPEAVKAALYVDDLLIYSCGTFVPGLGRRIQLSNWVSTWASTWGFIFSSHQHLILYD